MKDNRQKRVEHRIIEALNGEIRVSGETRRILTLQAELSLLHAEIADLEEELFAINSEYENELAAAVAPLEKLLERLLVSNIINNVADINVLSKYGI